MKEYHIDWSISGTSKFMAETADDAQIAFDNMSNGDLAREGVRERITDPQTQEEIDAETAAWKRSWKRTLDESING